MKNNLMIGFPARHKDVLELLNLNISTVREWRLNGINIILCIITKTILHLKLFRDINSISSTLISMISKRHLNTISKQLKVQIIVSLSLKLDLLIRILPLRFSEKNGTSLKNQDSNLFSTKVSSSFTLISKSPNSEYDIYQYYT